MCPHHDLSPSPLSASIRTSRSAAPHHLLSAVQLRQAFALGQVYAFDLSEAVASAQPLSHLGSLENTDKRWQVAQAGRQDDSSRIRKRHHPPATDLLLRRVSPSWRSQVHQLAGCHCITHSAKQSRCPIARRRPAAVDQTFTDFDGVSYHLEGSKNGPINLSIDLRCWRELEALGATDVLRREYGSFVKAQPENEYSVTLELEYASIPSDQSELYACQ